MGDVERDLAALLPFPEAMPLELLRLDAAETGLLSVLRHLLAEQSAPGLGGWETALKIAQERWGSGVATALVLAAMAFLRALRKARPGPFRHGDPLDLFARAHVSPEEAALLRMLCAMRRDLTPEARARMAQLTGGRIEPELVKTGIALMKTLPAPISGGVMSRPGPALRLVH